MGCLFGRPRTLAQRVVARETELKAVIQQLIRSLVAENEQYTINMERCRSAVQQENDLEMAKLYAYQMMQHRDNRRLIQQAKMQVETVLSCLGQATHQHSMELAFRGFGITLRQLNAQMPARNFARIAKNVGVELGRIETKRQHMNNAIETHMQPPAKTAEGAQVLEIETIISQFRLGTARVEELEDAEEDTTEPTILLLEDDDDALTPRLDDDDDNYNNMMAHRLKRLKH